MHCSVKVRSFPVPDMTYNVFGGTLSLTQSINPVIYGNFHAVNNLICLKPVSADIFILWRVCCWWTFMLTVTSISRWWSTENIWNVNAL